ncbi:MAG TPA: hypothetical protein VGN57_23300 [Pirellulaceae bacterium]|jgi:hypothetical protein|nr:hypothetical protein [Pirellulaceae bacterium]
MPPNDDPEARSPNEPVAKARRRRLFRFGLRTLLIAAFVASIPLALVGRELYRLRQEAAATETLLEAGAGIAFERQRDKEGFWVSRPPPPPDPYELNWLLGERFFARPLKVHLASEGGAEEGHVALLPRLSKLERVSLNGENFTDDAMEPLGRCRSLRQLSLHDTRIGREGFSRLANRGRIRTLTFSGSSDDESADAILGIGALSNLDGLELHHPNLTRKRLQAISELERLQVLFVVEPTGVETGAFQELAELNSLKKLMFAFPEEAPMGDADLAAIAEIDSLEELNFNGENVSDAGLGSLARATKLETLTFWAPNVADAGIDALIMLKSLKRLHLRVPQVTDAGIAALAEIDTLEELGIEKAQVTNGALESLGRLPNLKRLTLDGGVTEAAAEQFAAEHPQCVVQLNVGGSYRWIAPAAATGELGASGEAEAETATP